MQFTSINFLAFLALLIFAYYVVPKKIQWIVLLVASYIFYISAGLEYLVFILFTTITTYITARIIDFRLSKQKAYLAENKEKLSKEEKKQYKNHIKNINRIFLIVYLVLNFAVLFFCKLILIVPFNSMLIGSSVGFLSFCLPFGISFSVF